MHHIKKDTAFTWSTPQQESFQKVKALLSSPRVVKPFDRNLKTILATCASRIHGLGFLLYQVNDHEPNIPRVIKCCSTTLTPAQRNYATIELELLAILWACRKCYIYLLARHFFVKTDHKPLVGIMEKNLAEVENPRLLKFRESLAPFHFHLEWVAGASHIAADFFSRNTRQNFEDMEILHIQTETKAQTFIRSVTMAPATKPLRNAIDQKYRDTVALIEKGISA